MDSATIIQRLGDGHIGVIATDTLFGLVGRALDKQAVEKIYTIKKRDTRKPCIILLGSFDQLNIFSMVIHERFQKLLHAIWPGPVTVILRLEEEYHEKFHYLHRGSGQLTFRFPQHEKLQNIISATGPLIAPSANPEGFPPATSIAEIKNYFGDEVDIYLDENNMPYTGKPSTIIKIKNHQIHLVREGVVPFEKLQEQWTKLLL
jgi:L-threonylcarbamoyladenylate synthase